QLVAFLCFFFFFFQAEDGIRDRTVTGVQTCALPISSQPRPDRGGRRALRRGAHKHRARPDVTTASRGAACQPRGATPRTAPRGRSEERRVGKEWRGRGWAGRWIEKAW